MDNTLERTARLSAEEKDAVRHLFTTLLREADDVLLPGDADKVRGLLTNAVEQGQTSRDEFGFNPILTGMQTANVMVTEMGTSRSALMAAVLHSAGVKHDSEGIDPEVARIMGGLERLADLYRKSATVETENFRSLLVTLAEDMRVILIVIASRVNLLRQIKDTPNKEAQKKVATESAYLYAPLAHKLGLYHLKSELEDLSLKYLETEAYYHIKEKLNETKRSRDAYMQSFIEPVKKRLEEAGLKFHIKGRTKSIHSIWQKMKKQKVDVDGVYDLFAIRIILDSAPDREKLECWQVFSLITDMYQSNPKRMRDWLSVPKSNGYECLHITVLGPGQKWVEVQIRTERMDDIAEHGLAAHWRYKGQSQQGGIDEWLSTIRTALEAADPAEGGAMDQLKAELVEDEVFVFTPKGDLFKLPMGATVLDFAYSIHTNVGNHCTGAKIGNKIVTIKARLRSGDQVEILTSANQSPKQGWLDIVTTSKARTKIRQTLKEKEATQAKMAKEELERKIRNHKLEMVETTLMHTMRRLGYRVVTDFYKALAEGQLTVSHVMEAYSQQLRHDRGEEPIAQAQSAENFVLPTEEERQQGRQQGDEVVIDKDLKGIEFRMAKCCNPVYGDEVFGFVSLEGSIRIHRMTCPNAPQMRERYGYRIVRARWAGKGGSTYAITLHVVGNDDMGIVNNITSIISKEEKIQMRSISIDSQDGLFSGHLTVMLEDTDRLAGLIRKLKTVKGVKNVTRS